MIFEKIKKFIISFLTGGIIANIASIIWIISMIYYIFNVDGTFFNLSDEIRINLRIDLMMIFILINGISKSSLAYIIFIDTNRINSIIFWVLHFLSFLTFFMNVYLKNDLIFPTNYFQLFINSLFYIILLSNTLFFVIIVVSLVILSLLLLIFPNLRNLFRVNEYIHQLLMEEENDEYRRGLTEIELNQLPKTNVKSKFKDKKKYLELNDSEKNKKNIDIEKSENNKSINMSINSADLTCPICLFKFKNSDELVEIPTCKHVFHDYCIKNWLSINLNCPMCRSNVQQNLNTNLIINE